MTPIITVPAFSDNYIWLICDENQRHAAIVDPGDARPVLAVLKQRGIKPMAILITHFHHDHVGGIGDLLAVYPDLPVYGPANERIPHRTHALQGGETIRIEPLRLEFEVMAVHGHTAGHIAYYLSRSHPASGGRGRLFCGDTLFACGCGRVFDGTMQDLYASLQKIAHLPDDTLIYCAHEYTLDNIGFAKWVEPDNVDLLNREAADRALIDQDKPTVPSTLALEFKTNPFLRTSEATIKHRVEQAVGQSLNGAAEVFAAMRRWKDSAYD